ncbi:MAG TPA: hypothetical protein VG651_10830 [Stellaceae bacterium]|nr:hypothetical protein [Stellaceae bacterium]
MQTLFAPALVQAVADLGNVVVDPAAWPAELEKIAAAANAEGAALLGLSDRPADIPRTPSVDEGFRAYFQHGFHLRGLRELRGTPLLAGGARVLIDQDIVTADEVRSTEYYDWLRSAGVQWFSGVALWAGADPWLVTIQRTSRQGMFEPEDKRALELLAPRLTEAATLSRTIGQTALSSAGKALAAMRYAAVAIGRGGKVLDANAAADALFASDLYVKDGRLHLASPLARDELGQAIRKLDATTDAPVAVDPIVVARREAPPLVIRFLSVPAAARAPFLGARALLVLTPAEPRRGPSAAMLARLFGLTPAEARLGSLLAEGMALEAAAAELRIGKETARTQLKAIFDKTDTHRQPELVALLARIGC